MEDDELCDLASAFKRLAAEVAAGESYCYSSMRIDVEVKLRSLSELVTLTFLYDRFPSVLDLCMTSFSLAPARAVQSRLRLQ